MKTLGIKFEVAGVKEAQTGLNSLRFGLNSALTQNKKAVADYQREVNRNWRDWKTENFGTKTQKQNLIIRQERAEFRQRSTYYGLDPKGRNQVLENRLLFKEFVLDLKKLIKEDLKQTLEETVNEVSEKQSSFGKMTAIATAPFKIATDAIMSPLSAIIFGGLNKIGSELVRDFAEGVASQMQKNLGLQFREVGQDIGGAVGSSMYLAYEKIMTATRNSVIDRHPVSGSNETLHLQKLMDDLGQVLQGFALSLAAIPIKVKKRIDLDKQAIPQVKERAGELMINRKLTQAQQDEIAQSKSITVLTGGANYDAEGGTTDFAYRTLQPMLRGSYVHPVKNLFSNAQETAEFDRVFGEMLSLGMKDDSSRAALLEFAKNSNAQKGEQSQSDEELEAIFTGEAEQVTQKITDHFKNIGIPLPKILEVVFKGYNPDDIQMAAEGIFFKEKYPEKPLQFVGTSFGGFNAAGAAEIMERMGYKDVKAVGVTTPLVGMESTVNPDNYMSSIGDLDFLYEMTLGSIFKGKVPKPDNLQVVPGKGKGHALGHFLAQSEEFRNALQHFLKGRVDVPSMEEYSGKEVMAMGRIGGNNAESAIVRTIKKNLGENHDPGYIFNQEDLISHRDHLVNLAGGQDLKKIKNPQLKEFYQDYIKFLDTLASELETIEKFKQVGKKFKPINSLRAGANFYPDLGHFIPQHSDFEMTGDEFDATNAEVEKNKNIVAFKRKIANESPNIERTYRAMLGEDITKQGYGYYDDKEYQVRANEHLNGLIGYLENDVLKDASDSEKETAAPYLELLKKLKETILQVGKTGNLDTSEIAEAERLLGISLKEYKSIVDRSAFEWEASHSKRDRKNPSLNVKDRSAEIQAAATKAKRGNKKQTVMEVKPELESYIWAINQELIREGKEQIDINTAEYLGSGYKNHAIKANGRVYKFARHTNPLAAKVNKMMGKKKESYKGEIAALKKLQGENAPQFFAGGEEFMAMGEAEGITLKEALETASPDEIRELLQKSAKLLKSFHERGVAHNDFHPGNIIKTDDGNLVAIDWEAGVVTKNPEAHYRDREVAKSRFQDVLHGSMGVESKQDVATMFDDAYYDKPNSVQIREQARRTQQEIINRYNQQLNQIIENANSRAVEAINSNDLDIDVETSYTTVKDMLKVYRNAVSNGLFEQARETGELLLEATEYLKQVFNQSGDSRRGQLTRIQSEIINGDRGKGRSPTPLAELFYQTDAVQLDLDLWDDTADGARESLNSETGLEVGSEFAEGIIDGATDELDIQSPSKVFEWIGKMVRAGFDGGVSGIADFLTESMQGAGNDAQQTVRDVANSVSNVAQELDDSRGLLDPLFDTNWADDSVNDFFGNLIKKVNDTFEDLKSKYPILGKIVDVLGSIGGEVLQVLGIFSLGEALIGFATTALDTAMKMESLERSIISVSNSALSGARNISFVRNEAKRLSIDLTTAAEAYKRILGATQNTPLEGLQTEQLFSTLATTARNRGLNTDATNRLFLGFEQVIAKGAFKSEEVRGQLSEVMGDIQPLLASAVGVPVSQLSDLMESDSLKAPEVMPKLMALLNAQNAALGDGAQTAQAAQTRFNNAILEFQDAVGRQMQPVQKLGLDSLASALQILQDNSQVLIKLVTGLVTTVLVNLSIKLLATKLAVNGLVIGLERLLGLMLSAPFLAFAGKFLLLTIAIEVWGNVIDRVKNSHLVLSDDIKVSTQRLEALKKAFGDAGDAASDFDKKQPKQLQLNEGAEVGNWTPGNGKILKAIAGGDRWNLDNFFNNRFQKLYDSAFKFSTGFYKTIGLDLETSGLRNLAARNRPQTYANQKQDDFIVETSTLISNIDSTLLYGNQVKSVLDDLATLNTKATDLQSQTRNVSSGDREGLKKALQAENAVLKERDELLKKPAQYQEALQGNIADAEGRLSRLDELDKTGGNQEEIDQRKSLRKSLEERIKALESEKKAIDEINGRIPKFLSQVNRLLRNSNERVKGYIGSQEDNAVVNRNDVIAQALASGLSDAQLEVKLDNLSRKDLEDRISFVNDEIKSLEAKLANAYLNEGVAGLERAARLEAEKDGAPYLGLTSDVLTRLAGEGRSTAETEAANILLALDENRGILADAQSGLLDSIKTNQDKLKDFNKTVEDYFFRITQQIKEATIETQRLISQIFYTDIKGKLQAALAPGSNTFVNGIIDNVQSIIDQAGQVAQKIFGDSAAQLGFESETRTLATEMQDFLKEVKGASEALDEFARKLKEGVGQGVSSGTNSTSNTTTNQSSNFVTKTKDIANRLGIDPHALMTIMLFESAGTLSPKIQGPEVKNQGRGRGLIQFMPATARGLGTSDAALAAMTDVEQLDWVEKYFAQFKGNFTGGKLENLYAAVLAGDPRKVNASDGYTTARQGAARMMREYGDKANSILGSDSSSRVAVPSAPSFSTTGSLPAPPNVEATAVQLNQELVGVKKENLELSKQETEQLRESLATETKNKIELNRRQGKEGRQASDAAVLGVEDKVFGFKNQYGFPSATAELTNNLRSLKQQFIDADLDIASQITNTEDAITSITNSIPVLMDQIAKFKAIGTPEALLAAQVQQSAMDELTKTLPTLQGNLEKIKALHLETPGLEEKSAYYLRDQGIFKIEQEQLAKENTILSQQANLAASRGTVEAQRQLKIKQEELRLALAIKQIQLNTPEGMQRNEEILGEQRQSKVNKENIDYDAQLQELDIERKLLDYQDQIGMKKAGFMSRFGLDFGAEKLKKESAIQHEKLRFQRELVELEKDYKGDPEKLNRLTQAARELNAVNLLAIQSEFKSLGKTVEDYFGTATQGFFTQFTTNLFDGKAQSDRALLEERLRYAEEVVGLENSNRDTPGKLAHLKNRARELNEEKLDKIRGEFNLFSRVIDLARGALLEFVKQLAQLAAQQAASKFISSILGSLLGGVTSGGAANVGNDYGSGAGTAAFTASDGITVGDEVGNYKTGGNIKARKVSDRYTDLLKRNISGVKKAWRSEGSDAQLGVFHTGEELLSRKTGEAGRYQALKYKLGINPLAKISLLNESLMGVTPKTALVRNYAAGGTIQDVGSSILSSIPLSRNRIDLSGLSSGRGAPVAASGKTINIKTTVVTPNADSFRLNQDQLNQDLIERLRRGI